MVLFTVGLLLMFQAFDVIRFGQSWPILVIVIGLLLLLERSVGSRVVPLAEPLDASAANSDGKGL